MGDEERRRRRSGIGDARAFSPRGRTTRDTGPIDRTQRPAERGDDPGRGGSAPERKQKPVKRAARPAERAGEERRRRVVHAASPRGAKPRPGAGRAGAGSGRVRAGAKPQRVSLKATPPTMGDPKRRLRLATTLSLLLFAVIGVRLVQLQLTDAQAYAALGLRDRLTTIDLLAPRGSILDRNGAILAHSVAARFVGADPEMVEDVPATAKALSPLLGIAVSELIPKLRKESTRFVFLKRSVPVADAKKIEALKLPGIVVEPDEKREVPGDDLAANLIGFTGTDLAGLGGIEARFDELLRGVDGKFVYERGEGSLSKPIPGGYQMLTPAQPGSSLKLTIDRDVQFMVQRILYQHLKDRGANWGAAIVMNAQTGELLAQASYPTYNASNWQAYDAKVRRDIATSVVFDPGSIHKAIVLAAALQEGVVTPETAIEVAPSITKGDEPFEDTHPFPVGTRLSLPGLMAYSSNVATIKVADMLGAQKLYEYQRAFGLGKATGIGLPGEAEGLVQPPENWSGSSYGAVPIGHSVAVTALQMAAVYCAIANNGVWVQPHIVKETIAPDGKATAAAPPKSHRVISPENAAALRQIMEAVTVVDDATGVKARLDGYRISGKTGTGKQVSDGEYVDGEVASFIGMAPADQPKYVIAVFAHTPGGGGGAIAAPAFSEMMNYTLRHFAVPPTGTKPPEFHVTA